MPLENYLRMFYHKNYGSFAYSGIPYGCRPAGRPQQMKTLLEEFTKRAAVLTAEPGILEKRPSWQAVKAGAISLAPFADNAINELIPEHALCFILAIANAGNRRDQLLKELLKRSLAVMPNDAFVKLLSKFSQTELKDNLLPYIYEPGNRGAVACYLAAKLRVTLAPEAFQYFLKSRAWPETDLMNLSILVKPEEAKALCAHLETLIPTITPVSIQDGFTEFRNILFNHLATEPVPPELSVISAPGQNSGLTAPASAKLPQKSAAEQVPDHEPLPQGGIAVERAHAKQSSDTLPGAKQPQAASSRPGITSTQISLQALPENYQKLLLPVGAVFFLFTAGMLYFTWYYNDPLVVTTKETRTGKAPQQWVDSVTNRPVTAKFLAADKDFRMGELFLTRDMFQEALKLFEDALALDPDHLQALARTGYCRMKLGDNKKAAEIFQKVLQKQSGIENVNLYLARISIAEKNKEAAEKYFRAEFALGGDLAVGLELANFLARQGNQNEAMELIATLQEKNPGKMLVLAPDEGTQAESGGTLQ